MALMAAVFVGVAVAKWRSSRHPHAQGFVEVDQVNKTYIVISTLRTGTFLDLFCLITHSPTEF